MARAFQPLRGVEASALHLAECLVNDAQPLVAQRGVKGIADGNIEFARLFLETDGLADMLAQLASQRLSAARTPGRSFANLRRPLV